LTRLKAGAHTEKEMNIRTLAMAALLFLMPAAARAVTADDIIALSKAGVSAEVLVAVIDADRTIFTLTPTEIVALKKGGVPDAVVVKMLGSPQEFIDNPPPPLIVGAAPPLRVVPPVLEGPPSFVGWPFFFAVPVLPTPPLTFQAPRGFGRFINDGWVDGRGFGRFVNTR
jgi:hypothetical protein